MSRVIKTVTSVEFDSNLYPISHWNRLKRFAVGNASDPRGLFRLTDDTWEGWPYVASGTPSRAYLYRFYFSRFRSFLKLYAKWYCDQMIVGAGGNLQTSLPDLPRKLLDADRYISERGFRSIDDIASATVFRDLWDAQIKEPFRNADTRPPSAVLTQQYTRVFWQRIKVEFGSPFIVPPIAPSVKKKPAEFGADRSKIIPDHVIIRLANKLALHRNKTEPLPPFEHLRLCVLMLEICLGRRISEVLLSRRGTGPDGPLSRYPSRSGPPEGSLWFKFLPLKDGPADQVYISPEWEDLALYTVRELIRYGDEVRHLAPPEEKELLILVSPLNSTRPLYDPPEDGETAIGEEDITNYRYKRAGGLTPQNFNVWLNGVSGWKGVLARWGVTADGSEGGPIYRLLTHYSRHSRQSAIALDSQVPAPTRQRDLNHRNTNTQFAYQHRLRENNDSLLMKIKEGKLLGRGVEWLSELLAVEPRTTAAQPSFKEGRPALMDTRIRTLVRNNPLFFQINGVPGGFCTSPMGLRGCAEFMNCTSACEGGCHSFVTDVSDVQMLYELNKRADDERRLHQESVSAGRVVQAQKRAEIANRTDGLRNEAMRRASEETLTALRNAQREVEAEGL